MNPAIKTLIVEHDKKIEELTEEYYKCSMDCRDSITTIMEARQILFLRKLEELVRKECDEQIK